jgi:hypothetical protein
MWDTVLLSITLSFALGVSYLYYKELRPVQLRVLVWTMIFWLVKEVIGVVYYDVTKNSNHFIYNIYILPQYLAYFFIFYKSYLSPLFKKITLYAGVAFIITYIYNIFILKQFYSFSGNIANNVGELITLALCCLYMAELLMQETFINYFRIPSFWIATGLMFYCTGNFVYFCMLGYILKNNLDPQGEIYMVITSVTTNVQFGLFTIGLLCNKPWIKVK